MLPCLLCFLFFVFFLNVKKFAEILSELNLLLHFCFMEQILNLHSILSKSVVKAQPTVLWCYKDKLELSRFSFTFYLSFLILIFKQWIISIVELGTLAFHLILILFLCNGYFQLLSWEHLQVVRIL